MKTYIAFAIDYCEAACGCGYTRYHECYERNGNTIKRFNTYDEAKEAALAKMKEYNADNWNVI
jgi:hypothetical protein